MLNVKEKEMCVLRYRNGENIDKLANEYSIHVRTIYGWHKLYDGTIESITPKSTVPPGRHPRRMPEEEERRIIEIVSKNPQITDRQLAEQLGTNRNPSALHRKREQLVGKRTIYHKYDYACLFSRKKVNNINSADILEESMPNEFYVIEVVPNLFLRVKENCNPICVSPYITTALKFKTRDEAENFIETIKSDDMLWIPSIRLFKKP